MHHVDDHLFAGAGLPADQQVHIIVFGEQQDMLADQLDGGAGADQLPRLAALEQFKAAAVFELDQAAADLKVDRVDVKRLLHIVERAFLDRSHRL